MRPVLLLPALLACAAPEAPRPAEPPAATARRAPPWLAPAASGAAPGVVISGAPDGDTLRPAEGVIIFGDPDEGTLRPPEGVVIMGNPGGGTLRPLAGRPLGSGPGAGRFVRRGARAGGGQD